MIVIDIETTGLDEYKNSIVSIGALDFFNPNNQFYQECGIWAGSEINPKALEINGFSEEQVRNSELSLKQILVNFLEWAKNIENKIIAAENPDFDKRFLKFSIEKYRLEWPFGHRTVDLHSLSVSNHIKRKLNYSSLNLDKTLNYVGLPQETKPHNALTGAKLEAEALSRLINGKSLLKEFEKYEIPNYLR